MSLILAQTFVCSYIMMAGDRRRIYTYQKYKGEGEFEVYRTAPIIDEKEYIKVFKLSKYALYGASGLVVWADYFGKEMRKKIKKDDDLDAIKLKLSLIIKKALEDPCLKYKEMLGKEGGFQLNILGFRSIDGTTGMLSINMKSPGYVSQTLNTPENYGSYAIQSPVKAYDDVVEDLFELGEDIVHAKAGEDRLKWIHEIMHRSHPEHISSNGDLHVIQLKVVNDYPVFEHEHIIYDTK